MRSDYLQRHLSLRKVILSIMKKEIEYPSVPQTPRELKNEAKQLNEALKGKVVAKVWRHRAGEIAIEFSDGTRFFADWDEKGLETTVTES